MPDTNINHLQPSFQAKVEQWLKLLKANGIEIKITETLRSFERSAELYAQGRNGRPGPIVTNAKPGQSLHNFGLAVDCYPIVNGKPVTDFDRYPHLMDVMKKAAQLAAQCSIEWGGNWLRFRDLPHFQDKDAPALTICRQRWPNGWQPNNR
ncbi:MAG: M15 family metallopeptidase [Acidobacteriota bacterium]